MPDPDYADYLLMTNGRDSLREKYETNSRFAERFAYLILIGLAVDIAAALILGKEWLEAGLSISADFLIVIGVWGELHFEGGARTAGDGIVAEANARAAEANASAAKARLETERLRAQVAWRRLSPEQGDRLSAALASKVSQLHLEFLQGDPEATQFADDFLSALCMVPSIKIYRLGVVTPDFPRGVVIKGENGAERTALESALKEAGISFEVENVKHGWPVRLLVGSKPPPF
jgi:hypothetical protein